MLRHGKYDLINISNHVHHDLMSVQRNSPLTVYSTLHADLHDLQQNSMRTSEVYDTWRLGRILALNLHHLMGVIGYGVKD